MTGKVYLNGAEFGDAELEVSTPRFSRLCHTSSCPETPTSRVNWLGNLYNYCPACAAWAGEVAAALGFTAPVVAWWPPAVQANLTDAETAELFRRIAARAARGRR
jgi:hypothetical protein